MKQEYFSGTGRDQNPSGGGCSRKGPGLTRPACFLKMVDNINVHAGTRVTSYLFNINFLQMKKYMKTVAAILACVLTLSACSSKSTKPATVSPVADSVNASKNPVPVKVITLSKTRIARTIDYTSTILPFEEVNMAPSTPGRIEKINVEVGDKVARGDELFLMDRSQLYQLKVQLASLARDISRLDTLLKTGSARQQQYDQMATQYDVMKTSVDFMERNTIMKAPFNGVITGKYFEDGEMYSGAPTTMTGRSAIVTIMQVNPLKVNVSISERYFPLLKKGMRATLTADVYEGEVFTGTVYRVSPTINPATRSFDVELEVPNRNDLLKPGMFVRVSIYMGEEDTFVVPASSVLVQEGTNERYIFIDRDGTAGRVEVTVGKRFDDKLEIISATLREGSRIVNEGQSKLVDGDRILLTD
jgi:RND family efflux transporter MFP subunit